MTVYQGSRYVSAPISSPPRASKALDNPAVDSYLLALQQAAQVKAYLTALENAANVATYLTALQNAAIAAKKKLHPAAVPTLFPKRPGRKNTGVQPVAFNQRQIIQGDRFDLLAVELLGDAKKWWMLADINPEVFFPFDDLEPGSIIRYPISATKSYAVTSQTFLPQVFARVFDGQSKPA